MRSRTRLATELAVRAEELERERDAYAREAVRYERARIARDLHDIVAHSLSMIVVQAGAGRRALDSSPATAAESLAYIEEGAHEAELEIDSLAKLLGGDRSQSNGEGLQMLGELVQRAAATGLSVTYHLSGAHDNVPDELAQAAYHVTQEGITNALKHAPGAPITVTVHGSTPSLTIAVDSGQPTAAGDSRQSYTAHADRGIPRTDRCSHQAASASDARAITLFDAAGQMQQRPGGRSVGDRAAAKHRCALDSALRGGSGSRALLGEAREVEQLAPGHDQVSE